MASKMVSDRFLNTGSVAGVIRAQAGVIAPALGEIFGKFLQEGETPPDVSQLQELLGRLLDWHRDELVRVDKEHIDVNSRLATPRLRRDEAVEVLSDQMSELRDVCQGLYGPLSRQLFSGDAIAQRPGALMLQAEHTLERLRDPELDLPVHTLAGVEVSGAELADKLAPAVEALRQAIHRLDTGLGELQGTQVRKNEAIKAFDDAYRAGIRVLEGLYSLAGRPHLADRVRPNDQGRGPARDVGPAEGAAPTAPPAEDHEPDSRPAPLAEDA